MAEMGTLYGVSLGPGDPGLITRRAWELLGRERIHWTYPVRAEGQESFALGIVRAAGLTPPADAEALVFPMTQDPARLAAAWSLAARRVLDVLRQGRDLLFLVEGDASTYSSFAHLAGAVRGLAAEVRVETVPGVTSYSAASARLRLPLMDAADRMAVLPANYGIDTLERWLDELDTLVLLKVKPLLDEVIDLLEARGLLDRAVFFERLGTPEERIVTDLSRLRGQPVNYLSLLLIRNPHRRDRAVRRR